MGRTYRKTATAMIAEQYRAFTGRWPIQDDLARVNCRIAGEVGHFSCGWCEKHNAPMFHCVCGWQSDGQPQD